MNDKSGHKTAEYLPVYQPVTYSEGYDDQGGWMEDPPYIPAPDLLKYLESLEERIRELENKETQKETQCESSKK